MKKLFSSASLALVFSTSPVSAHTELPSKSSAIDHAPIGVMGDHTHDRGEWMLSYRFMGMSMKGYLDGTEDISTSRLLDRGLRVIPQEMTTQMHMFGLMYAPTDRLTLMLMGNLTRKQMQHETYSMMDVGNGPAFIGRFDTETAGLGDTTLAAMWRFFRGETHSIHLNLGVSLPTGSITEEDEILSAMNTRPTVRVPYAMQLGSGTTDIKPGVTYNGKGHHWRWGAQLMPTFRVGENSEGYTWGSLIQATGWAAYAVRQDISASVRLAYFGMGDMVGRDSEISGPVTTADPDNYGSRRLDMGFGINWLIESLAGQDHRLAFEYSLPVSQDVTGAQLNMRHMFTFGYQLAF